MLCDCCAFTEPRPSQVLALVAWGPQALLMRGEKRREESRSPIMRSLFRRHLWCWPSAKGSGQNKLRALARICRLVECRLTVIASRGGRPGGLPLNFAAAGAQGLTTLGKARTSRLQGC